MILRDAVLSLLLILGMLGPAAPGRADSFGRPDAGAPIIAAPKTVSPSLVPKPVRVVFGRILAMQRDLNAALRRDLDDARTGRSWHAEAAIILISFAYGVLHAIGPGHGKLVVGAYFLSRRARILQGLAMSSAAALVQALSAILLVGGLVVILRLSARQVLDHADSLEMASYALIAIVGISMIRNVATRRVCCDLAQVPDHHHDHGHEGHAHDHGDDHLVPARSWPGVLATGAAVGVRPCSGAILVLLFTLANGIFPVGILATLAMAAGVAITVSAVSLTTLGVQRSVAPLAGFFTPGARDRLTRAIAYGGGILITAFGLIQVAALWSGALAPSLG